MRSPRARSGWALVAIAPFAAACNTVLGVESVALAPDCDVDLIFGRVASDPATDGLFRHSGGGPALVLALNRDARPDVLNIFLYKDMGGHGVLEAPGSYPLTNDDARLETCGICVGIDANFDFSTSRVSRLFLAFGQGSLTLTRTDSNGVAGWLEDLEFRSIHVTTEGVTQEINDDCSVTIQKVEFDLNYSL